MQEGMVAFLSDLFLSDLFLVGQILPLIGNWIRNLGSRLKHFTLGANFFPEYSHRFNIILLMSYI